MTPETCLAKRIHQVGAVAQLGERLNGIQEAVSSILSSSTKNYKHLRWPVVSAFFVPMLFVPVLCQFFYGDQVKSWALMGTFQSVDRLETQVAPVHSVLQIGESGPRTVEQL